MKQTLKNTKTHHDGGILKTTIAQQLRGEMKQRAITQDKLAELMNTSTSQIFRILSNTKTTVRFRFPPASFASTR